MTVFEIVSNLENGPLRIEDRRLQQRVYEVLQRVG